MYGPIIRKIRVDKGLPLKSIYSGICSKTNAIKFEKGERSIGAEKFYPILENLMITMEEFQWIKNDYKPSSAEHFRYMISQTWNKAQEKHFQHLIRVTEEGHISVERVQLASYQLLNSYHKGERPEENQLQILMNYFSDLNAWTLSDLKFFANNCYILPYDFLIALLKETKKVRERYSMYQNSAQVFATLLTNSIDRMIVEGDIENAQCYLKMLFELSRGGIMAGYHLVAEYYVAKIKFLFENHSEGKEKLYEILKIAELFEYTQIMNEINLLIGN